MKLFVSDAPQMFEAQKNALRRFVFIPSTAEIQLYKIFSTLVYIIIRTLA